MIPSVLLFVDINAITSISSTRTGKIIATVLPDDLRNMYDHVHGNRQKTNCIPNKIRLLTILVIFL